MDKLKTGSYTVSLKTIKKWLKDGTLRPYENNRGNTKKITNFLHIKTALKTVNSVVNNLDVRALGSLTVVQSKGEKGTGELVDWHSRAKGLLLRDIRKFSTPEEDSYKILVNVYTVQKKAEKLKIYETINIQQAHTISNRLDNPDYLFGYTINKILDKAGIPEKDILRKGGRPQLANTIYCYAEGLDMAYHNVFKMRSYTKDHCSTIKSTQKYILGLNEADIDEIVASVKFYKKTINEFIELFSKDKKNKPLLPDYAKSLPRSASFLGLLTSDYLSSKSKFCKYSPKKLANKIYGKLDISLTKIKSLTGGTSDDLNQRVDELYDIIKVRGKK